MIKLLRARIHQGHRTLSYPDGPAPELPARFRGHPVLAVGRCAEGCAECAEVCPTGAITLQPALGVDLGKCLFCAECAAACPTGALTYGKDYRLAARERGDLEVSEKETVRLATALDKKARRLFGRSLKLRQVSAGGGHTCARRATGRLYCWGSDADGELGEGPGTADKQSPVPVAGGWTNANAPSAGGNHTCATRVGGRLYCWGQDTSGQLGEGAGTGDQQSPVEVNSAPTNWAAVAAGNAITCGRRTTRRMYCWGDNSSGQLGNGQFQGLGVIAPQRVVGITNAIALAAGDSHTCAVLATGSIKCWGQGGNGRLGDGLDTTSATPVTVSGITNAVAVTAGTNHTCALLATGAMRCWGLNGFGQLGNGNNNIASVPAVVSGITTATAIDAGFNHSCARLADSTLRCWGSNFTGALGRGNFNDSNVPVAVAGVSTAVGISAGGENGCTVLVSGSVQCWGESGSGQLGNGQVGGSSNSPVTVIGITTAVQVTSGDSHSCARLAGGALQCWGSNSATQLGINTTAQSSVPVNVSPVFTQTAITVAAGGIHTCALRADSAAICWGSNAISQLGSVIPGPSAVLNWMSSNATVAAIDAYGLARAIGNGATSILASFGGISASTTLTVQPPPDADGDGVADQLDNCVLVANPTQLDANNDGFGNICDADLDNSGLVTAADFGLLRSVLNQPANFSALAAAAAVLALSLAGWGALNWDGVQTGVLGAAGIFALVATARLMTQRLAAATNH